MSKLLADARDQQCTNCGGDAKLSLSIIPMNLDEANAYVQRFHKNHHPVVGHKFCLGVGVFADKPEELSDPDKVVGVCIVGRPVSRHLDNGWTLEITRVCTDGTRNVCSMLYGAAWRVCKSLGYRRLITYTLPSEGGASLRASNYKLVGLRGGGNWNVKSRPRIDTAQLLQGQKLLWEAA